MKGAQSRLLPDDNEMISELESLKLSERIVNILLNEKNKPEGKVRILWVRKLIQVYGFPVNQLDINVPAGAGREADNPASTVKADIVLYRDQPKTQPFIVVETKAEGKKKGLAQAEGYARVLGAEYYLWSDGAYNYAFKTSRYPNLSEPIGDIPRWVGDKPLVQKVPKGEQGLPPFKDEEELRKVIKTCHDLILEKQGHDPAKAFDEMTKLLFLKLYDEREVPNFYEFVVLVDQSPKQVADNIRNLFSDAVMSSKYKDVFFSRFNKQPDMTLELDDFTIFRLVQILQGYSLANTTDNVHGADIKGTVFEKMVGETFRGELAQFFTPREIVEFVIDYLNPSKDDVIFDPACGSGGFLIMSIHKVRERIKKEFRNLSPTEVETKIKYFAEHNLLGVDINERMATVAKMNMIMHGDGHAGIYNLNGLFTDPETPRDFVNKIKKEGTIIVSNPPFAGREKDANILKLFDIGKNKKGEPTSVSKELLFIENIIKLSKPDTRIGLVIPSGVFNNPSSPYVRIREIIRTKTKILALIALPHDAFRVSGANNEGNLMFLERMENPPPIMKFISIGQDMSALMQREEKFRLMICPLSLSVPKTRNPKT